MNVDNIVNFSGRLKIHYTLEELEEINRDLERIMRLTDSLNEVPLPSVSETRFVSNIYPLRPDITLPGF